MKNLENMGEISEISTEEKELNQLFSEEALEKYRKLCELCDSWEITEEQEEESLESNDEESDESLEEQQESETESQKDDVEYETDDNGQIYKENGEVLSNTEYEVNGNTYQTDEYGRIVECDGNPKLTEEGKRNISEQMEAGGEDRREGDQGGHIVARVLGGSEGIENLVAMRGPINQGDYKKMENEIRKASEENKEVSMHVELKYKGESERSSEIKVEYTIDGEKKEIVFDNEENSIELLDSLEGKLNQEDYNNLKEELQDMKEDGKEVSITSVKTEFDENGQAVKITVGVLDESNGLKTYKVFDTK